MGKNTKLNSAISEIFKINNKIRFVSIIDLDGKITLSKMKSDLDSLLKQSNEEKFCEILLEMKARLLGWNDETGDIFRWPWVRYNFPDPVLPNNVNSKTLPLTCK